MHRTNIEITIRDNFFGFITLSIIIIIDFELVHGLFWSPVVIFVETIGALTVTRDFCVHCERQLLMSSVPEYLWIV